MTDKEIELINMISEEHGQVISNIFLDEYRNYKLSHDIDSDKYLYNFFSKFIQIKFLNPLSYLKSASAILSELPTTMNEENSNSKTKKKNTLQIESYNQLIDDLNIDYKSQESLLEEFIGNYNLQENNEEASTKREKYFKKIFKEKKHNDKFF